MAAAMHKQPLGLLFLWSAFLLTLTFANQQAAGSLDLLPHPCDQYTCPPMVDIQCPEDSQIRDTMQSIALLDILTAAPTTEQSFNVSELIDDVNFVKCCLAKKCVCNTCYIPDCANDDEVVIELLQESMDMPGHCCGKYECRVKPNCTEVRETDTFWLHDCKRCKCFGGAPFCHQSCDEGIKKPGGLCISKTLNRYFEHGHTWKDGCYECECVHGEAKCKTPFCRGDNCEKERQVMLQGGCCPICWPKGVPMPNDVEGYDHDEYECLKKQPGFCYSKNLNQFFENGKQWRDGCHDCTCIDGREMCSAPECQRLSCAQEQQVTRHGACCPICWPAHVPMPNATELGIGEQDDLDADIADDYDDELGDDDEILGNDTDVDEQALEPLPDIKLESLESNEFTEHKVLLMGTTEQLPSSTDDSTTDAANRLVRQHYPHDADTYDVTRTTQAPSLPLSAEQTPCNEHEHVAPPATYQVYPEVVEVVQPKNRILLYSIIGTLLVMVIVLSAWNCHLRAKQRSYRPVSNFDDNCNKTPAKIKQTNDCVFYMQQQEK